MTDRHDPSSDPTPDPTPRPGDAADRAGPDDDRRWFRSAIEPVVDADPVPDDWEAVRARVTGEGPTPVALGAAADRPRRTGRLAFAAAAAVILLAGVVGVLALTGDPAGDPVATEPPTTDDASEATGWYVPTDLPDGWTVRAAELDLVTLDCPCRTAVWVSPDRARTLTHFAGPAEPGASTVGEEAPTIDLADGVSAQVLDRGRATTELSWYLGDQRSFLVATGWERNELVEAARSAVATDGSVDRPAGLDTVVDMDHPRGRFTVAQVAVTLAGPDGRSLAYGLSSAGSGTAFTAGTVPVPSEADGLTGPLFELDPGPGADIAHPTYLGPWPGADVQVPVAGRQGREPVAAPGADDVDRLVTSLRPATAQEWQAFLADAETTDERLLEADRLADLGTLPEPPDPAPVPGPEHSADPTGTTTVTGETPLVPGPMEGPVSFTLDPAMLRLPAGGLGRVRISVRNETAMPQTIAWCTPAGFTTWQLVSRTGTADGVVSMGGTEECATTIPPLGTIDADLTVWAVDEARRPLPAGGYTLLVERDEGTLTLPTGVHEPPCDPVPDDLLDAYLGRPASELDLEDGPEVRVVDDGTFGPGLGFDDDLVCDRLNVGLRQGEVWAVTLG